MAYTGEVLTYSISLVRTSCGVCQMHFAMPSNLENECRESGRRFFCPNGHSLVYTDSENKRLKREKERLERQLSYARTGRLAAEDQARTAEYQRRAAKGQLTRIRNRIANGVCPCCRRSFTPLAEHMRIAHPDFVVPDGA